MDRACRPARRIAGRRSSLRRRAGCRSAPRAARWRALTARAASSETRPRAQTRRALLGEALAARREPGCGVDDQVDVALPVQRRPLRAMAADADEAEPRRAARRALARPPRRRANSMKAKPPSVGGCGGSNELDAARTRRRAPRARPRRQPAAHLALEVEQRAHRVDRGAPVRRLAEDVVEDLERQRAACSPRAAPARRRSSTSNWPWPGKLRKWRAHCSTSMASSGASAIWTKKMLARPGSSAIAAGSSSSDSVWKLSRIRPRCGWSARATISHASR